MIKPIAACLTLWVAAVCAAQSSTPAAQPAPTTRHYRLTFVLSYPQGQQPPQNLVLDVPVTPGGSGRSSLSLAQGPMEPGVGGLEETIQCTDVHASPTGLATKVTFMMHSVGSPLPNSTEPIQQQLHFERKVDLVLQKPTRVTEEMHRVPLKKGDEAVSNAMPSAPQITVTAVAM